MRPSSWQAVQTSATTAFSGPAGSLLTSGSVWAAKAGIAIAAAATAAAKTCFGIGNPWRLVTSIGADNLVEGIGPANSAITFQARYARTSGSLTMPRS